MQGFNVSREVASRLINKSLRTIDRYIQSGKIRYIKTDGRTWLAREDVLKYANDTETFEETFQETSVSPDRDKKTKPATDSRDTAFSQTSLVDINSLKQDNITLQEDLSKNKHLLSLAIQKIKSLKTDLSKTVNLEEHNKAISKVKSSQKKYIDYIQKMDFHYKTQEKKYKSILKTSEEKINSERLNRNIISFVLALILIIQPILIYLIK